MFGERGVLRPGQTLVERDDSGLCVSRQCSRSLDPMSGFHLLRTSSTNCSAHCQPVRPPQLPSHRHHSQLFQFRWSDLLLISVHIEHFQNQIYTPPKDQSTCCGVCKNISCLYQHENGTSLLYKVHLLFQNLSTCASSGPEVLRLSPSLVLSLVCFQPGRSWVSNCMKFDCADTLSGPTLISYSFSCPPFNETECTKVRAFTHM